MPIRDVPKRLLKALIFIYAYAISPLSPAKCRFYPTCSAYAAESIERHGAGKGMVLAIRRLLRCHPWHKGPMMDPVPASIDWTALIGYKSRNQDHTDQCGCGHENQERSK